VTLGVCRGRILLPQRDFDSDELRYILTHELIHIKRRDIWYSAFVLVATAIHWFNPIVYLIGGVISHLCEVSCDEEIVRDRDSEARLRYCETIIGVMKNQSRLKTVLSTRLYSGKKGLKERLAAIMDTSKRKAGPIFVLVAVLLTSLTGVVFAEAKPITVSNYNSASAADAAFTLETLLNWDASGNFVIHDPMPGQINEDLAIKIAKETVPRIMRHITAENLNYYPEINVVNTLLGQIRAVGQAHTPLEPQFSFWVVHLSIPGESTKIQSVINAKSGFVWFAEIRHLKVESSLMLSAGKLVDGYLTDLGFNEVGYDKGSNITAKKLSWLEYRRKIEYIGGSNAYARVQMESSPYMKDGEPPDKFMILRFHVSLLPAKNGINILNKGL
jgi:hypothetical protein